MKIQFRNYSENLFSSGKKNSSQNGFSLIEIIFSIGIITTSVISLLLLFGYNVRSEADNKNKLVAVYLAQESIEIVRQLRDNNWFNGNDWKWQIPAKDVIVIPNNAGNLRKGWNVSIIGAGRGWKKKVYLSNGFYVQSNGVAPGGWVYTGFDRFLTIKENDLMSIPECFGVADCIKITSHVYFRDNLIVEATAYLYGEWY